MVTRAGSDRSTTEQGGLGRRRAAALEARGANYQQRRAEIIEAAATVFRAKGYRGTSLADIAAAVGADRATLYYYVDGKEDLLDAVVSDVVRANLVVAEEIAAGDEPAPAKLRRLMTQLMTSYAEHYPVLYVYVQENLAHVAEARQPWATEMRSINHRYEEAVEAMIRQGIDEGSLRAVVDPRIMANGLMGMLGWTSRWFNPERSTVDAATIGAAYAEMLLAGMAAPTPADSPRPRRR